MSDHPPPVRLQHLAWKHCQVVERLLTPARPTCVSSISLMSARTSVAVAVERPLTPAAARITPFATALMTVFVFHRNFFRSTHDTVRFSKFHCHFSAPLQRPPRKVCRTTPSRRLTTPVMFAAVIESSEFRWFAVRGLCSPLTRGAATRTSPRSKVQSVQAAR